MNQDKLVKLIVGDSNRIDGITATRLAKYIDNAIKSYDNTVNDKKNISFYYIDNDVVKEIERIYDKNTNYDSFHFAYSAELLLKVIYVIENYDAIKENNPRASEKDICKECFIKAKQLSYTHKQLESINSNSSSTMLRSNPSGHYLYTLLENTTAASNGSIIPDYAKTLLKYQIMVQGVKEKKNITEVKSIVSAPDLLLMFRDFTEQNIEAETKTNLNRLDKLSTAFMDLRYAEWDATDSEKEFLNNVVHAAYIVCQDLIVKNSIKLEQSQSYNEMDEKIQNDSSIPSEIKNLKQTSPGDYLILINKFKMEEIQNIIANNNPKNLIDISELIKYYIFSTI